ncbi:MAG: hypothetical protein M1822_002787 [Bathelium mastoideum]|nr:MAG: hypothetical protein M1822_002787 [Bathelium mastoideum]
MGQYYQNAMLTVAVMVPCGDEGFIKPRARRPFDFLVQLPYQDQNGIQKGSFYVYKRKESVDDLFLSEVRKSELFKRGWVFQEWILSRRIVYFTPSQIFWECQTEHPRNEGQDRVDLPDIPLSLAESFTLKTGLAFSSSSVESMWYQILQYYSGLSFTMIHKDRIAALVGVATEVRETFILKDIRSQCQNPLEYVSGLWLRDIHYGLIWQQKGLAEEYCRVDGVPSWSWASLDAEVEWPIRHHNIVNSLELRGQTSADGRFDVDNVFASLHLKGHVQILLANGPFQTKADVRLAAWTTGVEVPDVLEWIRTLQAGNINKEVWEKALGLNFESRPWNAICSLRKPDIIVGWGSFEPANYAEDSTGCRSRVNALHVSTEKGLPGGIAFGSTRPSHEVCNVLFIEKASQTQYRPVGVGKIFESEIMQEFAKAKLQEIELI